MAQNRTFDPTPPANRKAMEARRDRGRGGAEALGEGTPAGVDIHDVGQADKPEQDWGEPAGEGAAYSANHTRRPVKTEADHGQGRKTRAAQKDQVSRRV